MRRLIPILGAFVLLLSLSSAAKESIKIMYLQSQDEERAAVLIGRLDLPLEVYRLGIFRVGERLYAGVRLGASIGGNRIATKYEIATLVASVSDRIFGEFPDLQRIDFEGVSKRETKDEKPEVLCSASVDRNVWKTIPKNLDTLDRLEMTGITYFDPSIREGSKPVESIKPAPVNKNVKKAAPRAKSGNSRTG